MHFYYVSSHNMGLLSLVYPLVLFYHCIFHRVKLTSSAELYKFLLLSMNIDNESNFYSYDDCVRLILSVVR